MSIRIEELNITMRNSTRFPRFYISKCGNFYQNCTKPKETLIITKNPQYTYLMIDQNYIHQMVGHAWVFNPRPKVFNVLDHISGDTQENHANNLRWVTTQLNCLNRKVKGYEKKISKTGGVYYRSCVVAAGVKHIFNMKTKEAAIAKTKETQQKHFDIIYKKHMDVPLDDAEHQRSPHHILWTDEKAQATKRAVLNVPTVRRDFETRFAKLSL